MHVLISNKKYEVKKISVQDFLDNENLVPITIFKINKQIFNDKYQSILNEIKLNNQKTKEQEDKELKDNIIAIHAVLSRCIIGLNDLTIDYCIMNQEEVMLAYMIILNMSLNNIKIYNLTENNCIYIDMISKRYGKAPIEILMPIGGYNDLYAFLFNQFIFSIGLNHENKMIEKQNLKMRKNYGR